MRQRVSILFICLICAVATGAGQDAPRPLTVRIDAVVTDRTGRPLLDLKASDFELRAAGVAQAIDAVEVRTASAASAGGRTFALFLDEFHVGVANTARVRETMRRFVDEQVRPADRVVVMKPLDSQLAIDVAMEPAQRRRAIESFEGRAGDFAPRTEFESQYFGRAPSAVAVARAQIVTAALRALVTRVGDVSAGRSAVAFVSEGFAAGGRSDRERRLPDFQSIARVASRGTVSIYALNPAGGPEARAPESPGARKPGSPDIRSESAAQNEGIGGRLRALAVETGGEGAAGEDMAPALARMSRDLDSYYVLTFKPTQPGEGRFHRLELTSKRRDAVVRARTGFWTPSPTLLARMEAPPRPVRALKRSALIQSWYGLTRLADGRMRLRVTWEPARGRSSTPRPEPHAVVIRAARSGGASLFEGNISARQLAELIVPAGRVELDLTIVGRDGAVMDREARDVDVPDADAPRVTSLPPEIIRTRTLREFQAASADPAATPTPSREFRRSDRLIVRAAAINTETSTLSASARLLNRWGQPMRELALMDAQGNGIVQFDLPLAWLMPGEYEIEFRTKHAGSEVSQKIGVRVIG